MSLTSLSEFLERFPTLLHYKEPDFPNEPWVFWSKNEGSEKNSSSSSADLGTPLNIVHDTIKSAFSSDFSCEDFIAQLWAPVTIDGRCLLSTSGQPFAVTQLSNDFAMYRLHSEKYEYDIDENKLNIEDDPMIRSGCPATVFLNRFPSICDLPESLESYFGIGFRIMLPICFPSQSDCIGVLEFTCEQVLFSMSYFVIEVVKALQKAGLDVCNVQQQIPYKTINGLTPAKKEITRALEIVCKSHNVCLAQAWIPFEDKSHLPLSSNSKETRRILGLKLTSYIHEEYFSDQYLQLQLYCFKNFESLYDLFPLGTSEEHILKTLQDFKPRYNSKLHGDLLVDWKGREYDYCAFAICLSSLDTSDFSFAFRFIWCKRSRCDILLEAILLTIKKCLPSFKFASGVELGDELEVIEVGCPVEGQKTCNFKIFQGKGLSPTPKALEKGKQPIVVDNIAPSEVICKKTSKVLRDIEKHLDIVCSKRPIKKTMVKYKTAEIFLTLEVIEKHYDKPMKEAAKILNVSESTLKRKLRKLGIPEWPKRSKRSKINLSVNQSYTNEEDYRATEKPSTMTIKAEYAGFMIKISHLNSQATFETIYKEIGMKLKLSFGTYNLTYLDEDGDWILLTSDEEMSDCIESSRKSDRIVVRLRVQPSTNIQ